MRERYGDTEVNASWKAEGHDESSREFDVQSATIQERTLLDRFRGRAADVAKVLTIISALTAFGELPKAQALNLPPVQKQESPTTQASGWRRATPAEQAEAGARAQQREQTEETKQTKDKEEKKEKKKPGRIRKETDRIKENAEQQIRNQVNIEIWRQQGRVEQKIGEILRFPR